LECSFATLKRHLGALPKARETTNVEDILEKSESIDCGVLPTDRAKCRKYILEAE
jgi:hypothetical protein